LFLNFTVKYFRKMSKFSIGFYDLTPYQKSGRRSKEKITRLILIGIDEGFSFDSIRNSINF
jgi:hypothetical protein